MKSWTVMAFGGLVLSLCFATLSGSCASGTSLGVARDEIRRLNSDNEQLPSSPSFVEIENGSLVFWRILAVTVMAATVVTAAAIFIVKKTRFIKLAHNLPGPSLDEPIGKIKPHMVLGHLTVFIDIDSDNPIPSHPGVARSYDNLINLTNHFQKDGIFRLWAFNPRWLPFLARPIIFLTDAGLVRQLLMEHSKQLIKQPEIFKLSHALVGDSFLALPDTKRWKHQRKLTALGMHQFLLERANVVLLEILYQRIFPVWDKTTNVITREASEWCSRLIAEVLGIVAFSRSFCGLQEELETSSEEDSLFEIFHVLNVIITRRTPRPPILNALLFHEVKEFNQHEQKLNSIIESIVDERLAKQANGQGDETTTPSHQRSSRPDKECDLLSCLMASTDDDECPLTKRELTGNVRMLLFAGQDTTSTVLSETLHSLAINPAVQQRLQTELNALFERFQAEEKQPAYKDIMQLEYLDAVVKEGLRLHAPVGVARQNEENLILKKGNAEYFVPKGSDMYIFPCFTGQGNADDDGMREFRPERFINAEKGGPACFIPFSVGPRNCVGQPLAVAELKVILAHMIHRYQVRRTPQSDDPIKMVLLTVKSHQIMLDFERRSS